MPDETLLLLANDVRNKTLKLVDGLSEEDARFAAPGLHNSILWHAGHALVVVEHLSLAPLSGGKLSYPAGYFETFGWKSNPQTVTNWPTLAEVRGKLAEQREKLVTALQAADAAKLDAIVDPQRGRSVRWSILHGLHDEAGHQGEIWMLRKMLAKKH